MALILAFAFISGVITILSPCIIPVLPIVLSGGVGGGKARPSGVIAGFVLSFTFFTLALSSLVVALGIPADAMRTVAIVLIVLFGIVMLVPRLRDGFEVLSSRLVRGPSVATGQGSKTRTGFWGGIPVGLSLGLVWTPCVGPIMASVISLALTRRVDGGAIFITLAYSLGTAIPMFGVMLGGRALIARVPSLAKKTQGLQRFFGVLMLAMGLVLALQWDRSFQTAVLKAFPAWGSGLTALENLAPVRTALETRSGAVTGGGVARPGVFSGAPTDESSLGDWGSAPDFVAAGPWFNSAGSLDLAALRGKVVLVDFWTYSCVNCIRTLPWLQSMYNSYRDKGFVVIGVHSPEFAFEQLPANVSRAMRDLGVSWPVVLDNDFSQWNAYGNRYWPAHYFIDATGRLRYWHFGEGGYAESEGIIRQLLAEEIAAKGVLPGGDALGKSVALEDATIDDGTPETYLGYARGKSFASAVKPVADRPIAYSPARVPANGEWNLTGTWTIAREYIEAAASGSLELGFDAKEVYLVIEPGKGGGSMRVRVDGLPGAGGPDLKDGVLVPTESRLYHLVSLPQAGPHRLHLDVTGNMRLFAFTFG